MAGDVLKLKLAGDRPCPSVEYLFEKIKQYYLNGGVFVRAQLARMRPSVKIAPNFLFYRIVIGYISF